MSNSLLEVGGAITRRCTVSKVRRVTNGFDWVVLTLLLAQVMWLSYRF